LKKELSFGIFHKNWKVVYTFSDPRNSFAKCSERFGKSFYSEFLACERFGKSFYMPGTIWKIVLHACDDLENRSTCLWRFGKSFYGSLDKNAVCGEKRSRFVLIGRRAHFDDLRASPVFEVRSEEW